MKKTIRDSVFNECGPVEVKEDHIEVASVYVGNDGIRGLTIEEQVAQLRRRLEVSEEREAATNNERTNLRKTCDERWDTIQALKAKLRKARSRK